VFIGNGPFSKWLKVSAYGAEGVFSRDRFFQGRVMPKRRPEFPVSKIFKDFSGTGRRRAIP
jgi:hypothetical protein